MKRNVIYRGDCQDVLPRLPENSFDSVVTDPPYHLTAMTKRFGKAGSAPAKAGAFQRHNKGFMGKEWDGGDIAFRPELWEDVLWVLKPGGYLLAFGGTRTYHRMVCAIEDAGFTVFDCIAWMHGQGFPKVKTHLKPAMELIVVARKPLSEKSVAANVERWGTGALNIDACRIGTDKVLINTFDNGAKPFGNAVGEPYTSRVQTGRWPANVILDPEAGTMLDEQSGTLRSGNIKGDWDGKEVTSVALGKKRSQLRTESVYGDQGGASRFFFTAKASKKERGEDNLHPTVKPLKLMRYLVKLVTPPSGAILDPFLGSGTTALAAQTEGFDWVGIERETEYVEICKNRLGPDTRVLRKKT